MSDVDKRVVQMDFDNKKFEKNVKQSTESLNTLKASLNFDGVSNSIDQVTVKINRMEYAAAAAIANITNRVINLGIQIVKSLSIDNISAGWTKFGQKTTSIATLMAQTLKVNGKVLEDDIEKLSTVNDLMDKLVWFSDETSYTFTDMVDNASKFIAAGLDLDVSVKAMEGIATWAALSGQNASTASRAMYQLSQAMGKGKIQLIDWKSIQTANMDTAQFRENVLETAVAMGQLTKEGDKFITKTGKKFTQNQFTEQLSSGWFTSEVLTKTLEKYSGAADEIYALAEKEGKTASEIIAEYGDTLDEFGVKAFKAAQEARTLSDAITSVKDAVASKWMTTSELIFGDKDEAVELWTDLANELYEVFAESGNFRNEILKVWKTLEGRSDLFSKGGDDQGAFWNIYDAIVAVKKVIKDAWNTIFPITQMEEDSDKAQEIGNSIKILTSRFKEFTKTLKISEVNSLRLKKVFEGIFSIFKGLITLIKAIKFVIDPVIDLAKQLVASILDKIIMLFGKININGEALLKISDKIHDSLENLFDKTIDFSGILATIIKIAKTLGKAIVSVTKKVFDFIKNLSLIDKIKNTFFTLGDIATKLKSFGKSLIECSKRIIEFVKSIRIFDKIQNVFVKFQQGLKKLIPYIEKVKNLFASFGKKIVDSVGSIIEVIKDFSNQSGVKNINKKITVPMQTAMLSLANTVEEATEISNSVNNKATLFSALIEVFKSLYDLLIGIFAIGTSIVSVVAKILKITGKILQGIGNTLIDIVNGNFELEGWQKALLITAAILVPIVALVAFITKLVYNMFYTIVSIVKPIGLLTESISGVIDKIGLKMVSNVVSEFAKSILEISVSLLIIATINPDRLWPAVAVIATISAIMAALVVALIFIQKQTTKITTSTSLIATQIISAKRTFNVLGTGLDGLMQETKKLLQANAIARVLQAFGLAMLQVALALYIMAGIDTQQLWIGVRVMAAITSMIMLLAVFSKKNENNIKNALPGIAQMLALSIVIKSLGKVLNAFKNINKDQRINVIGATVAISAFLGLCVFFLQRINNMAKVNNKGDIKKSEKMIKQISTISTLILSFAVSIKILSTIPWNTLGVTLGVVGAFLVEVAGLLALINLSSKLIKNSSGVKGIDENMKQMLAVSLLLVSFAASVAILSSISWSNLGVALGIIGGFFIEFAGMIALINLSSRLIKKTGDLKETTKQMLAISLLLYSFSITILILSKISWNKMAASLGAIGIFFIEFAGMIALINLSSRLISKGNSIKETTKQMLAISLLLMSFAASVSILSLFSWDSLIKAVGSIGIFFAEFAGLVFLINLSTRVGKIKFDDIEKLLIGLSLVLISFAVMAKIIESIDIAHIFSAAGAIAIVFVSIAVLCIPLSKMSKSGKNTKSSLAIIISMIVMLAGIAAALRILSDQPWNQLLAAAGAIGIVLMSFTAMAAILGKDAKAIKTFNKLAKSFLIFSVSLVGIGVALAITAQQPWNQLLAAAGSIALVMATLIGAVKLIKVFGLSGEEFLKDMAGLSAGLVLFSAAIIIFAVAVRQFESIDWMTIIKALAAVAMQITVLALAAAITQKIIPAILALASAFLLIGLGMILSATAIQIVTNAIMSLCNTTTDQMTLVKDKLSEFISIISDTFSPLLSSFLTAIANNIPTVLTIVQEVIHGIIDLLATELPHFIDMVVDTVANIVTKLAEKSDEIFSGFKTLVTGMLNLLEENAEEWTQSILNVVISIIKTLSKPGNVDTIIEEMFTFVKNLLDAIVNNLPILGEILKSIMDIFSWLLKELVKNVINIAGDIAEVLLTLIAVSIQIVISSLGALSKLFLVFVSSILLILAHTFSGLSNVIFEVFKVIVKECLKGLVDVIIYFEDAFKAIGIIMMELIARGIISVIQSGFGWLFDVIDKIFGTNISESLENAADELSDKARAIVNNLEGSTQRVQQAIKNTSNNITDVVDMAVEETADAVNEGVKQIHSSVVKATESLGEDAATGYTKGIQNSDEKIKATTKDMIESGLTMAAKTQDSHSPSKVYAKLGMWAAIGYANGIADNAEASSDIMTQMVTQAITAAQDTINSQNGDDLTIKVGMDISGIEEQSRNISSIMSGINNVTATAYGRNATYNSNAMNKETGGGSVINTDNSKAVTYNNVFNVTSTDPEKSAEEIDRALNRQAMMAKLAHGGI